MICVKILFVYLIIYNINIYISLVNNGDDDEEGEFVKLIFVYVNLLCFVVHFTSFLFLLHHYLSFITQ